MNNYNYNCIVFQSTLPQGERQYTYVAAATFDEFQSTLPQGERRISYFGGAMKCIFQSTLPQGERHIYLI